MLLVWKQVGFANGRLRIFDTAAAVLAAEMRQYGGAIQDIAFDATGARLYTAGAAKAACSLAVTDFKQVTAPIIGTFALKIVAMSGACKQCTGAIASSAERPVPVM
jgi:hypothetical protein